MHKNVSLQPLPYSVLRTSLKEDLRIVLNSSQYSRIGNMDKADILLDLENGGEYNPNFD